jgi:hypothetical protein
MLYFVLVVVVVIGIYYYREKAKELTLKKNGIKVEGIIIDNVESSPNSRFRLGGNINNPTVKFFTEDGDEIVGRPIVGFISQYQVVVPSQITVIYDRKNPQKFYLAES